MLWPEWQDDTPLDVVQAIQDDLTNKHVPILAELAGDESAAYVNEADVNDPEFQATFFGDNYGRLTAIKEKYDPTSLFIVSVGVGSEKWDKYGLCRVD
jgi:hypothetical protein